MRLWVVTYDISDERRRRQLGRLLGSRMSRVQESVFEGWLVSADARRLLDDVALMIMPEADSVRAYPLAMREPARRQALGCQPAADKPVGYWIV